MTGHRHRLKIRAVKMGATPTRERRRHNGGVTCETIQWDANGKALIARYRSVWTCPLDAYRDYRVITESEHRAGIRFQEAYYRAVLSRRAARERLTVHTIDMRLTTSERILKDAHRTLSSHTMGAVIDICGHEQPARDEKKLHGLKKGLGQLAVRWNMAAIEVCGRKPETIQGPKRGVCAHIIGGLDSSRRYSRERPSI